MDVILDTNVFRKEILFESKAFNALLQYITKTNSNLILFQIVLEEAVAVYKKDLQERVEKYNSSKKSLNSFLLNNKIEETAEFAIDNIVKNYMEFVIHIFTTAGAGDFEVIKYKNEYLPELINRSINRIRPCWEHNQDNRDALLWLQILDYLDASLDRTVAFITNNTSDFSGHTKNELHPDLALEWQQKVSNKNSNISLVYFNSIEDLLKVHATSIDFVTNEWLLNNLDFNLIEKLVKLYLIENNKIIIEYFITELELPFQDIKFDSILSLLISDFFIYEMKNNDYYINVIVKFNCWFNTNDKPVSTAMDVQLGCNLIDRQFKNYEIDVINFYTTGENEDD